MGTYRSITDILGRAAETLNIVRAVRAPLVVAAAAAIFLSVPPQTREIYRVMAEDIRGNAGQLALSLVLLCATCIAFAIITRELLRELPATKEPGSLRKLIPVLCASVIPAGLAIGLFRAAFESQIGAIPSDTLSKMPELNPILQTLQNSKIVLLAGAAVSAIITASLFVQDVGFRSLAVRKLIARRRVRIAHIASFGLICLLFFSIFSVVGSQAVGALGIFLLGICGVGSAAALLTRTGDRMRLPLLTGMFLFALLLSLFDLTDNHRVELNNSDAPRLKRAVDVFKQWYGSRADREFYESRRIPYPVFIVAASGGGLYAAYHAATVLSRIQDRCANFSQHLFAISGVSGGSLGGALFSALAKVQARNAEHIDCQAAVLRDGKGPWEQQITRFLETDFLSPILGAALFPDAVQRFVPAVTSRFERARAFEDTLTRAWTTIYSGEDNNPWSKPYLEHWNANGAAPALILNSTNVEHGNRVAITPFNIIDMGELGNIVSLSNLAEFHRITSIKNETNEAVQLRDTTLASAVSLSARFPWVLPAGRLELQNGSARLVDGGYVENSGTETIFDLLQVLERFYDSESTLRSGPPVKIHVIVISNLQLLQKQSSFGLGEILSPIRAMLSSRDTRAVVALTRISRLIELCGEYSECGKRIQLSAFLLNLYDFNLPLGWLLSPSTRRIVEMHSGIAARAGTYLGGNNPDDPEKFQRLGAYASLNDKAACQIEAVLRGEEDQRCRQL